MPDQPIIAIFTRTDARRIYLEALVRLSGLEVATAENEADFVIRDTADDNRADALIIRSTTETQSTMRRLQTPVRAARVMAVLQEIARQENMPARLTIAGHILDVPEMLWVARDDSAPVRLTEKETEILCYLHSLGPEGTASRDDLLAHVWSYAEGVETHTLETHIYRLRQKIEQDPGNPQIVRTRGDGYAIGGVEDIDPVAVL